MTCRWTVIAVAACLLLPRPANADDDAYGPKKRGDDAMDDGRYADALAAYDEAAVLSSDPALLYNKGRALEALEDFPRAIAELEAFERRAPRELLARVPGLSRRIAALRAKVTTVTVTCTPSGARIELRGQTIGSCPSAANVVVRAGKATLVVSAYDLPTSKREVDLPAGGISSFDVHLRAAPVVEPEVIDRASATQPRRGFEGAIRVGLALPIAGSSGSTDPARSVAVAFPIGLDLGFRAQWLYLGWYGLLAPTTPRSSCFRCTASVFRMGVDFHVHFAPRAGDPWLGIGTGYESTTLSTASLGETSRASWEAFHLQFGANVSLAERWSLGPVISYALACAPGGGGAGSQAILTTHSWFSVGVRASLHP